MISVYQNASGFRVVAGPHKRAREHANMIARVYADCGEAYKVEADPAIRMALLRIAPNVADHIEHAQMHHIERKVKHPWQRSIKT